MVGKELKRPYVILRFSLIYFIQKKIDLLYVCTSISQTITRVSPKQTGKCSSGQNACEFGYISNNLERNCVNGVSAKFTLLWNRILLNFNGD